MSVVCMTCGGSLTFVGSGGDERCSQGHWNNRLHPERFKEHSVTEKFVSPCPPPTPYQRELLEILIEECAEVQQRATKMLRFGVMGVQPGQTLTNAQRLSHEVGDVLQVLTHVQRAGMTNRDDVLLGMTNKQRQLAKYMQTTENPL